MMLHTHSPWSAICAFVGVGLFLDVAPTPIQSFVLPAPLLETRAPRLRKPPFKTPNPCPTVDALVSVAKRVTSISWDATSVSQDLSVIAKKSDYSPEGSPKEKPSSFDHFDYNLCWYPVSWARDLPLNKPTKITLFDVDYVVARIPSKRKGSDGQEEEEEVIALLDRCPHKSAALTEGRVTSAGHFQCAYHGWSFDGADGSCVEIPQVVSVDGKTPSVGGVRTSATAVPAMIHQGMVWLFPGGNLEMALLAPPPPRVPEMDMPGFRTTFVVRDFPVDWPLLIENLMDADHGLFAHGFPVFDLYSASSGLPQVVEEQETHGGKGWQIVSKVEAVEKLRKVDKFRRGAQEKKMEAGEDAPSTKLAISTFYAPAVIVSCRRDKGTGETMFLTAFWVCPVGTGRSRFMSAFIGKAPISVPRWVINICMNNFVDQDTYLLWTQQKAVLGAEATALQTLGDDAEEIKANTHVRKNLFVYRSPTERLCVRLGKFFDATLSRVPNRIAAIRAMASGATSLNEPLGRDVVLDRYEQHTRICPDSQDVISNCDKIVQTSKVGSVALAVVKVLAAAYSPSGLALPTRVNSLLRPKLLSALFVIAMVASWCAKKVSREFSFKYTEDLRDRDLKNIPTIWADKE